MSSSHSLPDRASTISPLLNAAETYPAMLKAISGAKQQILFCNFCMVRGDAFDQFAAALTQAAGRGVSVHLLLDAYGSRDHDPAQIQALRSTGIQFAWFRPFRWHDFWRYNRRMHKKLLIIDGSVGFTGGVGVGDYWTGDDYYPQPWRDTHFEIREKPLIQAMAGAFAQSWQAATNDNLNVSSENKPRASAINSVPRGILHGSPSSKALTSIIDQAASTLDITTAYFGPPRRLREALLRAAKRGVRLRLLVNGPHTNHLTARQAGRHFFTPLLDAGAHIYEYQPTKIHAKLIVADSSTCLIGSSNLNFRSAYHDEECNITVHNDKLAQMLTLSFEEDLLACKKITLPNWQARPFKQRLQQAVASLGRYLY